MRKKTKEEFVRAVYDLVGDEYIVSGEYINYNTKTKMFHTKCNNYYDVRPNHFLNRNHRCKHCSKRNKKSQEQFEQEVYDLVGDEYSVLGKYVNNRVKILMKHNKCNYEWEIRAASFVNDGNRCSLCNESKGEKRIRLWLEENIICYESQKEFEGLIGIGGKLLSYDFYLPEHNLLIEYQGEFHDGAGRDYTKTNLKNQQEHDRRKREYAEKNGIELLEIWYVDFNNIEEILNRKLNKLFKK